MQATTQHFLSSLSLSLFFSHHTLFSPEACFSKDPFEPNELNQQKNEQRPDSWKPKKRHESAYLSVEVMMARKEEWIQMKSFHLRWRCDGLFLCSWLMASMEGTKTLPYKCKPGGPTYAHTHTHTGLNSGTHTVDLSEIIHRSCPWRFFTFPVGHNL